MKPCWSCHGRGYFGRPLEEDPHLHLECSECKGAKELPDDAPSTFAEAVERERNQQGNDK